MNSCITASLPANNENCIIDLLLPQCNALTSLIYFLSTVKIIDLQKF